MPAPLAALLFGAGAIHGLDGAAHLLRKRRFLDVLPRERVDDLAHRAGRRLAAQAAQWPARDEVVVFNELAIAYGFAVLGWAGIACSELSSSGAAVELLNVLRPTVAVAWLGSFAVLALHDHPAWRSRLATSAEAFAEEVRRTAPFVPALTGLSARLFDHDGRRFRAGTRIVLECPAPAPIPRSGGTVTPSVRSASRAGGPTPGRSCRRAGGGYADAGHRCPGQPATVAILAETEACGSLGSGTCPRELARRGGR